MSYSLEQLLATRSFVGWVKGECSPGEKQYWDAWLGEHSAHKELAQEAQEIVEALHSQYEIPDPQTELQKLSKEIRRRQRQQPNPRSSYSSRSSWWQQTGTVAAGLIFLLALLGGIFAYQYGLAGKADTEEIASSNNEFTKEYTTGYGEKVTFRLSDGSNITLNAHSSLRFSSTLNKGLNTQVWLQGEAYFDIAHLEGDRQRTFTVHTNDGAIQVLGTRFSVNTFGGHTQTALVRGRASIRIKEKDNGGGNLSPVKYVLKPGEMAQFTTNDNKIAVKQVNTRLYTSWMDDKLIFAQTPMQAIARRIERTFGVQVVVGKKYKDERLTGSIRSDSLDVLARALAKILHAQVQKEGKTLQIGQAD